MNRFIICLLPSLLFWWTPIVTILPVLEARPVTVGPIHQTHEESTTAVSPDDSYWTESGLDSTTAFYKVLFEEKPDGVIDNVTMALSGSDSEALPVYAMALSSTVTGILSIVGTVGNGLVILAFCTYKQVRTSAHTFILSNSIGDIFMTGFQYPTSIASKFISAPALGHAMCPVLGSLFFLSIYVSLLSMVLIAFNRCIHITKSPDTYRKLFSPIRSFLWVLLSWVVSGLLVAPAFLGYGEFGWNKYQICSTVTDNPYSRYYISNIFGISYWLVFCVVAGIYLKIYFFVKNSVVTVAAANRNLVNPEQYVSRRVIKQTKHMFIIFSAFTVCTAPSVLLYSINVHEGFMSHKAMVVLFNLYCLNHVLNPFLYAWKLPVFRRAFRALIRCKRQLPFQPGASNN
ncbi:melatonin receptor type 1B-A-like [Branchiostoma floridae]|uniref:Melatonin receptor type 1B-A-like n=1 Tax=Branchiostoma floridae TaxID=7739 RepID=A0A9J7KT53_BRAFL|nr:melatonin receptor type 1B-A-like [Branchiostoma floridae]